MTTYKNSKGLSAFLNGAYTLVIFLVLVRLLGSTIFSDLIVGLISIGIAYLLTNVTLKSFGSEK